MNSFVLMGEVISQPELRYTPDNLAVASMTVRFPAPREDEDPYELRVASSGELAQSVTESCQVGTVVTIEGELRMNTVERDGRKEKVAEVIGRRVFPMGSQLPVALESRPAPDARATTPSTTPSPAMTAAAISTPSQAAPPAPAPRPAPYSPPPDDDEMDGPGLGSADEIPF